MCKLRHHAVIAKRPSDNLRKLNYGGPVTHCKVGTNEIPPVEEGEWLMFENYKNSHLPPKLPSTITYSNSLFRP